MTRMIVVVSAGLGTPSSTRRLAEQMANATDAAVTARGEALDVHHLELRELAGEIARAFATGGLPTPALTRAKDLIASADGIIAVSPVFSGSYSGLFKSFFDVIDPKSIADTPVLLGATAGTPRHSLMIEHAMRPLFSYLRAVTVPTAIFAATEDFGGGEAGRELASRIQRGASQFAALLVAEPVGVDGFVQRDEDRQQHRKLRSNTSIASGPTAFEALLKRHNGEA